MSATLDVPQAAATIQRPLTQQLILTRLLVPSKTPPPPSRVRSDLNRVMDNALSLERFTAALQHLRSEGLLNERKLTLTDTGRNAALAFLGVSTLPPRCTWQTMQNKFLVPLALRLDPNAADTAKKIDNEDHLGAMLLRRKERLPATTPNTINGTLQALACRELGFPDETCVYNVVEIVLGRLLGDNTRLAQKQLVKQLPRVLLNATRGGVQGLREAVLREWVNGAQPVPPQRQDMELSEFARTVLALARTSPTGHFGENKVFINHVWRQFRNEMNLPSYDLDTFKTRLVEANRQNLLTLSRADLPAVMPPDDVRESETNYLNAQYHFILVEKERP